MCELLGMNANVPTDICFSFTGLIQRGGATGPHKDGWGITFYEHGGMREFKDYLPSYRSPIAQLLQQYPIKSRIVISHIRQANVGEIRLENTHPFQRELWGRPWAFAHNGQMPIASIPKPAHFQPVGSTDSEKAFCWLLSELKTQFETPPEWQALAQFLSQRAEQINLQGVCNFLLSDGRYLFAFCSTKLGWITRRAPFGTAHLSDEDISIDFAKETTENDVVSVIATQPLTDDEHWRIMSPGELQVFEEGEPTLLLRTEAVKHPSPSEKLKEE